MAEKNESKKTILIVEDEQALSEVLAYTLKEHGYDVTVCGDGEAGLKSALTNHPDLILLDIVMPKMDGLEMYRELHKQQKPPVSPVIFFTNLNQMDKIAEALQYGADTYLIKADITLEMVVEKVKEFFAKSETAKS